MMQFKNDETIMREVCESMGIEWNESMTSFLVDDQPAKEYFERSHIFTEKESDVMQTSVSFCKTSVTLDDEYLTEGVIVNTKGNDDYLVAA